jgi:hypothetical protein
MTCQACWLSDLNKVPCLQAHDCFIHVNIPVTVTLQCYVTMTQPWSRPGGRVLLVSMLDDIPVTRSAATCSATVNRELAAHLSCLSEDLGELKALGKLALEIWPPEPPWFNGCPRRPLIYLERKLVVEHAPFVIDDGRGRRGYELDMSVIKQYGPPFRIETWQQWYESSEEKKRETKDGNDRKKPDRRA